MKYQIVKQVTYKITGISCFLAYKLRNQTLVISYHTVPSVGPVIVAYRSTSSTSIYVQWNHTIPQELVNGILIGYRVAWDDDHFSSGHPDDSQGYAEVRLDASNYVVTSLYEYWLYKIRVAGRTSAGHGIYTTVTVMTDGSSKCFTNIFLKFLSFLCIFSFRNHQKFKSSSLRKMYRNLRILT